MPSADPQRALDQLKSNFELDPANAVQVSAKTGLNVESILPAVVEQVPAPEGSHANPLKLLLVDSWYDTYKGVVLLVRVFEGTVKPGDTLYSYATQKKYIVGEVGIMHPLETATSSLRAGQVGYIFFNPGMKNVKEAMVGDTFTHFGLEKTVEPCAGFEEPKPMVFVGAFPVDQGEFQHLDDSIQHLVVNDKSVTLQKESSDALGQGWRLGFLGTLHCSVFQDRLRQEHGKSLIITSPTVPFKVLYNDGREVIVRNPAEFPSADIDSNRTQALFEPMVMVTITVPEEYLGKVIELCESNRGQQTELTFFTSTQVIIKYKLPLAQLVDDFFGKLKGASKGYASLDYEDAGYEKADVVKLQLVVNKVPVDAISQVIHRSQARTMGKAWVKKFKEFVDRQLFEVAIQATIGTGNKQVVARETVKAVRKDVTAKLYGGDVTRRMKLLEKQKAGKKKLKGEYSGIECGEEEANELQRLEMSRLIRLRSMASCRRRWDRGLRRISCIFIEHLETTTVYNAFIYESQGLLC